MRRSTSYLLALVIAGAFVGCGKDKGGSEQDNSGDDQSYIINQPEQTQAAREEAAAQSPEEKFKALKKLVKKTRANLDCPAKIEGKRDEGAPVDDIQGVRLGITYNEAVNAVLCTNEMLTLSGRAPDGYQLNHFGLGDGMRTGFITEFSYVVTDEANEHNNFKQKLSTDVETSWTVTTVGLPKQERVLDITRVDFYKNDKNPSLAAVEKALTDKYGKPTKRNDRNDDRVDLTWAYDTLGRPVVETSPLFETCGGLREDCGISINAYINLVGTNKALVNQLQVTVTDGANGYAFFKQTEKAYREMDEAKRSKELQDAEKNSTTPQL